MSSSDVSERPRVRVENIGGIDSTTVELSTDVNVLTGKNATNRTSFLRSIMAALGSENASLKADADSGFVRLTIGGETYERRFERRNGTVVTTGDPYLEDPTLANLFAFLLESNEARQAVRQGRDLREIIMRPVDLDAIEAEIEQAEAQKRQLDEELERLTETKSRLPELEGQRQSVQEELAATRADLEDERAALDETRAAASDDDDGELEAAVDELQRVRTELENVRFTRETETESIQRLESELADARDALSDLPDSLATDPAAIEAELTELREQRSALESATTQLQSIIQFNEEMLEGTNPEITSALTADAGSSAGGTGQSSPGEAGESVTDRLLEDDTSVVCWTCGSTVDAAQIESTIERLRSLRQEKLTERSDLRSRIDDRKGTLREAKNVQSKRERLQSDIDRTTTELEDRRDRLEELDDREDELQARVSDLESKVSDLETTSEDETLDQQKRVTELEFEVERLEAELESVESELSSAEADVETLDDRRAERAATADRLTDLRTRIDRIERESVEAFNQHMASVLDVLDYDNLARIWIEQTEETVREGRRHVEQSTFELHIVRQTERGETYEDIVSHLSESEREVTGLVFALAGYLVHDVHDSVPFMLLDSLEAIDSDRIARLVDYFNEYAETVVTALLPEDAAALDEDYTRITSI